MKEILPKFFSDLFHTISIMHRKGIINEREKGKLKGFFIEIIIIIIYILKFYIKIGLFRKMIPSIYNIMINILKLVFSYQKNY